MPKPVHRKDSTIIRQTKHTQNTATVTEKFDVFHEDVPGVAAIKHPAMIGVSVRLTQNLENGNFIQTGITVDFPCAPSEQAMRDTHSKIKALALELLEAEVNELKGIVGSK